MRLSICIPTYNRSKRLISTLDSISKNKSIRNIEYEVCISDNNSKDGTRDVVKRYSEKLNIHYKKNDHNIGMAKNIISVVDMANGQFIWMLGDDDLLLPKAISKVNNSFVYKIARIATKKTLQIKRLI